MHILFITTHNFSTNPRLGKEIDLAIANNFKVSVVCFGFNNWSKPLNDVIKTRLKNVGVDIIEIPAGRSPFFPWFMSSLINKLSKALYTINNSSLKFAAYQLNKRSWLTVKKLKAFDFDCDLIVAHNPGSFYPALFFSKRKNIPFGIDIEDYHPGETSNSGIRDFLVRFQNNIFSQAFYCSAASPLILEYCKSDMGDKKMKNEAVVCNLFSSKEFTAPVPYDGERIKIIWFSQNIAAKRGLEEVIPVVKKLQTKVELHLFGNQNQDFVNEWLLESDNIFIHKPLLQIDLHKQLSLYDIGLAIEPGKDLNNKLALSNKIFAYMQAGLYVIASPTDAQQRLLKDFKDVGIVTSLEESALEKTFLDCYEQKNILRSKKLERFEQAKSFSWETESNKLLSLWKKVDD